MRILEALCGTCDETFMPHAETEEELTHFVREDGAECGGRGEVTGEWRTPQATDRHGRPWFRDRHGLRYVVTEDGPMYITDCCDASAKGSVALGEPETVCRACYRTVDDALGGVPETREDTPR